MKMIDKLDLLKELCSIHAPAGSETPLTQFVLDYIEQNARHWKVQPEVFAGDGFQDCIVVKFGNPRTAVFAHLDSIGFSIGYGRRLLKIGGPVAESGYELEGITRKGKKVQASINVIEPAPGKSHGVLEYKSDGGIERGTPMTFRPNWREDDEYVQCCYMDNRLGVWNALRLMETLENGVVCFSCWEEHGGGAVPYLAKFVYEQWGVKQALISDITWVTEGVHHSEGVAISMRDSGLPRRSYVNRIIDLAEASGIPFQLEVESAGGSDGNQLQASPYPFDWCFIGAPEDHVHSPNEKVHKTDIKAMMELYRHLMEQL